MQPRQPIMCALFDRARLAKAFSVYSRHIGGVIHQVSNMKSRLALILILAFSGTNFLVAAEAPSSSLQQTLLKKANAGDVKAMETLAFNYTYGVDTDRNDNQAILWLERAAKLGSVTAYSGLGDIYGEQKNYEKSFFWYSKAAEHNYSWAVFRLGIQYQQGWHVQHDVSAARRLLEKAARLGSADAQHFVGLLYSKGEIFPKSEIAAYAWIAIAAASDNRFVEGREVFERTMSKDELSKAQELILELDKTIQK
jgi:TPR repeat protein